jgi:hypothetical protein
MRSLLQAEVRNSSPNCFVIFEMSGLNSLRLHVGNGSMNLIPLPKIILYKKGFCELDQPSREITVHALSRNELVLAASEKITKCLEEKGLRVVPQGDNGNKFLRLSFSSENQTSEAYLLNIGREGVVIAGEGPAGLFRGAQTLLQLIKENGTKLPCLEIDDKPDFPVRGFLHDITRGKVPTLTTLKSLVDKLAYYKINQLQLYIEHTFAFRNIPELWQNKDPLTAVEIMELDAYCRASAVELVPSLATFGHLYELLRLKRFEHLNELDIQASTLPHNLWDRMAHYTIDVSNKESYVLIKSMIDEFVPLFSSGLCNICCDETFDLGKGKNKKQAEKAGTGRLYVDFIKKLMAAVREHGKTPMIWGDIILHHPELIGELPGDTVFLNWGYGADVTDSATKSFAAAGVKQYVCPGVQGWNRFANDINVASDNIRKMIHYGMENGAVGMLNTDWGDCGHVNFLSSSFHGMALGAALSWNSLSFPENWQFDSSISAIEWNEPSGTLVKSIRELGSLCFYHFGNMYAWVNGVNGVWNKEQKVQETDYPDLAKRYARASEIAGFLKTFLKKPLMYKGDRQDLDEFIWSAEAIRWTLALLIFKKRCEYGQKGCAVVYGDRNTLLGEGRRLLDGFELLWRRRDKESELRNVTETFKKIFSKMEGIPDDRD